MESASRTKLEHLATLWQQERQAVEAQAIEERQNLTLDERIERGVALKNLWIVETDLAAGGRTKLWLQTQHPEGFDALRVGSGTPVRLWWDTPDNEESVYGTVSKRRSDRLCVIIEEPPPYQLEEGNFQLDREESLETFNRGQRAIETFLNAPKTSDLGHLREILFDNQPGHTKRTVKWQPQDPLLNDPQKAAIENALSSEDLFCIHGPPGTGKTRTLVEIIVQAAQRGQKVLATAASNAAVDNLAIRLVQTGLSVVRLGHPARVSNDMEAQTLDALLEQSQDFHLAKSWFLEAYQLRKHLEKRKARGQATRQEKKETYQEIRRLQQDARRQLQGIQSSILERASVICTTATGADSKILKEQSFDLVVLDEATQSVDPITLIALSKGKRTVMAGDHCQLPPTVIDRQAEKEGLGTTLFEQIANSERASLLQMLTVQYRMHRTLMTFPSESMYDGKLLAAPGVEEHTLTDLEGVQDDELRVGPLVFIDSAGKGWDEERSEKDPSTSNPGEARRIVAEVERLLERGISPTDLAVITPYFAQVRLLQQLLQEHCLQGLEVGTIDGFQGREKEAIVLDLVRSNENGDLGFLRDLRRMNVALTRAKRFLLVLGDSATIGQHPFYDKFITFAEENDAWQSAWDHDISD